MTSSAVLLLMVTLALASIHTIAGKLYAIEQPGAGEGINEDKCTKIFNCKIIAEYVFKYPDKVSPFNKNEQIEKLITNNLNDPKKIQEQSCQKFMDLDIEKTKDQQPGERTPTYLICLP